MRKLSFGIALALSSLLVAKATADERLARELDQHLSRLEAAHAGGSVGEREIAPLRPLLREMEERHARREREFERISRIELPAKAQERLKRARDTHRAATIPVLELLQGLVRTDVSTDRARAAGSATRGAALERLGEVRAILRRMEMSSRTNPISSEALGVHAPSLRAPALGQASGATTEAPVGHVPQVLRELAAGLGGPIDVYRWVRNAIAPEFYYGAMKGALETYLEASGNDADTAALLVQLLRAQGVPARFVRGTVELSGTELVALCGTANAEQAVRILERSGIPYEVVTGTGGIATVKLERVWAEAYLPYANYRGTLLDRQGGAWIPLDPGFKRLVAPNTFDVVAELGLDPDATWWEYLTGSGGPRPLEFVHTRISQLLTETAVGTTYEAVLNVRNVVPEALGILPNSLPYRLVSATEVSYDIPKTLTHDVRFLAERDGVTLMDATFTVPELLGRRLTLSYLPFSSEDEETVAAFGGLSSTPPYLIEVKAVLRLGGVPIAAAGAPVGMGVRFHFRMELGTPGGTETASNDLIAGNLTAIGLSGRRATAGETSDDLAASILADLAWSYFERWNASDDELARLFKVVGMRPTVSACLVMSAVEVEYAGGDPLYPLTFDLKGILIDADLRSSAPVGIASRDAERPFTLLSGLEGSVLEHRVFEDRHQIESVSTAKALGLAAGQGGTIHDVTAANADEVLPELPFDAPVLEEARAAVDRGRRVLIPDAPVNHHLWSGVGYVILDDDTGEAAYQLQGGYSGGMTATDLPPDLGEILGGQEEESEEAGSGEVAHIYKAAFGDYQDGIVGEPLALPLKVFAVDEEGQPVEGATVTFMVRGGGGTLIDVVTAGEAEAIDVRTDSSGAATVGLRLGVHTGDMPRYICETGIDCCDLEADPTCQGDETGHATQVGLNLVTAFTTTAILEEPFNAFGYPDRGCASEAGCPARFEYVSEGGYVPNMRVAGLVVWKVVDQYDNPLSNFQTTLAYQPPPTLDDPGVLGWGSRCRNQVPDNPTTPGGVLRRSEYEACAEQGTPVRQSDCPGSPSVTSLTSAFGVSFYPVVGDSPFSAYRFVISDSVGDPKATVTYHTWGFLCSGTDPNSCGCGEPGMLAQFTQRPVVVNAGGDMVEAYPPEAAARTAFGTDVVYEKESIEEVRDSEENPHYFARGTNVWVREPLDDSAIDTSASTPGTQVTGVVGKGDGQYEGEMRMSAEPQLNSLSYSARLYPLDVPYLPIRPSVTPPSGLLHEVDPAFVDPATHTLTGRIRDTSGQWTWQGTFSLWGARPRLAGVQPPVRVTAAGTVIRDSLVEGVIEPPAFGALLDNRQLWTELRQGDKVLLGGTEVGMTIIKGAALPAGEYVAQSQIAGVTVDEQPLVSNQLAIVAAPPCQLLTVLPADATGLTLSSTYSPWDGTRCTNGTELRFAVCEDAEVSFTIGGRLTQEGVFAEGEHAIALSPTDLEGAAPADPENPRRFDYVLRARSVEEPTNVATVGGVITLQSECNRAVLPVGRTFVKGVDLYDGHLVRQATDLKVPGRHLGLEVTRTYSSSGQDSEGLMGAGWAFNYEAGLVVSSCGLVIVKTADGSSQVFRVDAAGKYEAQPGYHTELEKAPDGSFDFWDKAHVRHHFEGGLASRRRLLEIEEPHGDRLVFTYHTQDINRLVEVGEVPRGETTAVRRLRIAYTGATATATAQPGGYPRITSVAIPELRLEASYSYDDFGNLVRVTRSGLNLLGAGGRDAEPTEDRYEYSTDATRDRHQLLAAVDANGHRTEYVFFSAQDLFPGEASEAASVDPEDKQEHVRIVREFPSPNDPIETSFAYDMQEVLSLHRWNTTVTDGRGSATLYVLNLNGSPLEIREPLGRTTSLRWATSDIHKEWEKDALGRETDFSYDAKGNLIAEVVHAGDPSIPGAVSNGSVTTSYLYDLTFNKLIRKTDGLDRRTTYTLDDGATGAEDRVGDLTDVIDAVGNHTHHEYDDEGRLTRTIDPRGSEVVHSEWDTFGNPCLIVGPGSYWKRRTYDERGRLRSEWDSLAHRSETEYDGFDRVVETRRLSGTGVGDEVTATWYYPNGQTRVVMNALGAETVYTRDGLDRVVLAATTVPRGRSFDIAMRYDPNGNKVWERDARGVERELTYDALNRLISVEILGGFSSDGPTGVLASYGYDLVGNKTRETDLNSLTTRFEYDGLYRVRKKTFPQLKRDGSGSYEEEYHHDAVGNLRRFVDANGKITDTEYDGLDRVTSVTRDVGGLALTTTTAYDDPEPTGSHVNKSEENDPTHGLRTTFLYDLLSRETSRNVHLEGPGGGGAVYTTATTYEDTEHAQITTDPRGMVSIRKLDGLDRMVEETVDLNGFGDVSPLSLTTTVVYDGLGNKKEITDPEDHTTQHDYDGLGRLIHTTDAKGLEAFQSYFADGSKESETDRRGVRKLFTYDNIGRLRTSALDPSTVFSGVGWSHQTIHEDGPHPRRIEKDARGKSTIFDLDGMGRVIKEIDALGHYRIFEWDGVNKVAETDKRGAHHRTTFEYDGINRLTKTTDPVPFSGQTVEVTYEDAQNRVTEKDRRGSLKVTQTDPLGRVLSVMAAVGTDDEATLERHTYDANGNRLSSMDAEEKETRFTYDAANRSATRTDGFGSPEAALTSFVYDKAGNILEERDARAAALDQPWSVQRTYDELNRLSTETDGEKNRTTYGYDEEGNRTSVLTPRGKRTTFEYDELGKLTKVTQPPPAEGQPNPVTSYLYDENRNRIRQTDANGHVVAMEYDELNRLEKTTQDPTDAGSAEPLNLVSETLQFDENGNPLIFRDPKGQTVAAVYDELNRLASKRYAFADADPTRPWRHTAGVEYGYDANGNLLSQQDSVETDKGDAAPGTSIVRTYDLLGRLKSETAQIEQSGAVPTPVAKTVSHTYWKNGVRETTTDPESGVTSYTYDDQNRLATVTTSLGTSTYTYFGDGLLETLTEPDGSVATHSYDLADRLLSITHAKDSTPIASYVYTYDENGNRLTQVETNGGDAETTSYGYDDLDRLARITCPSDTVYANGRVVTYGYDAVGNRIRETETAAVDPTQTLAKKLGIFDNANRLTRLEDLVTPEKSTIFTWDPNGNQTSKTTNGVTTTNIFDIRDKLVEVQQGASILARYQYDAEGRLLKKIGEEGIRQYVYDQTSRLAEYDEAGNAVARFHYGSDRLISMWQQGEGTRFYHLDGLRSVIALTDTTGAVTANLRLDTWGNFRFPDQDLATSANRFAFTGHVWEPETGLYYAKARFLDPKLGRFISQDSFLGELDDPPSLHRYMYAADNPARFVDPSGHFILEGMLGKQLEKLNVNLVGGLAGTSWGQKVNFAANAGLQLVARGLQVPTKISEGLADVITPGGREYWTGEERTEAAGPYRQQQINALNAAGNSEVSPLERGLNAAAAVLSTPAVVIEEMVVAPAMKVPQQCSDVGVHIAQAQNTRDPVEKAVHYLEATRSGAEAAGTMLGLVVGARAGLPKKAPASALSDEAFVQRVATKAESTGVRLGKGAAGTGPEQGIWKHDYAKRVLRRYQKATGRKLDLVTEESYLNKGPASYGDPGSSRPDVFNPKTGKLFDYKFVKNPGKGLRAAQKAKNLKNVPNVKEQVEINP